MSPSLAAMSRPLLGNALFPGTRLFKNALLVIGGSLALAISAKIQVPFWPVPITMQSMVALLIGVAFGSRLGALTILAYLAEGLAGLPVFAGAAAGPAYLAGPTGGYLLGFLLGGAFAGWAAERGGMRQGYTSRGGEGTISRRPAASFSATGAVRSAGRAPPRAGGAGGEAD